MNTLCVSTLSRSVHSPKSKIVAEIQLHFLTFYKYKKISHKMYKRGMLTTYLLSVDHSHCHSQSDCSLSKLLDSPIIRTGEQQSGLRLRRQIPAFQVWHAKGVRSNRG